MPETTQPTDTPSPGLKARARALVSDVIERARLASSLAGIAFDGARDLFSAFGYKRKLTPQDYRDRYDRGDVAARVVDALPKATWLGGGELVEDEDPTTATPFEEAFDALAQRLQVWPHLLRVDILAGLGEYAVLLIGARGDGTLSTELPRMSGPDDVLFLKPWGQADVKIGDLDTDPRSARYGQPKTYRITSNALGPLSDAQRVIHHTRIVHVADGALESDVLGQPRLRRPWNRLDDIDKVAGGGSEAFFQRANQGLQLDMDPAMSLSPEGEAALTDEVDEYFHGQRRIMRTKGITMRPLGSDVANFGPQIDALLSLVAAGTEIPKRILSGSEMGELASSQDRNNWNDRIGERRNSFAGPCLVRPLVDRLIAYGALPAPVSYEVRWPEMETMTEGERAALGKAYADMNAAQGETVITTDEIRDLVFGMEPLDEVFDDVADETVEEDAADDEPGDEEAEELDAEQRAAAVPMWRRLHKTADRHVAPLSRAFAAAVSSGRASVGAGDLAAAIRRGTAEPLLDAAVAGIGEALAGNLARLLTDAVAAGGTVAGASIRSAMRAAAVPLAFDATHPAVARWVRAHAAESVDGITWQARRAIRTALSRGLRAGLPPQRLAGVIRPMIGLTERQARAVLSAQARMLTAQPGSLVMVGRVRVRVPSGGLDVARIDRAAQAYAERLVRQRALTIARTESLAAVSQGQRELWRQAVEQGVLTGAEERVWVAAGDDDRICPTCEELDGTAAPLDGPFAGGVDGPPAHASCRCVVDLVGGRRTA